MLTQETPTPRRRRSAAVSVSLVAVLSVAMTGCGSPATEYNGVCVDKATQRRVDDKQCDEKSTGTGGSHGWVFYRPGQAAPGVGGLASGGTTSVPHGASVARGGAPAKGGVVARGGFGGKNGSVGG